MKTWILAAAAAALLAAPAAAQPSGSAETFVRSLYARYYETTSNDEQRGPQWRNESVYAPALVSLLRREQQLSGGEVGFIDADWICQCQDYANLRLGDLRVTPRGRDRAAADVRFTIDGGPYHVRLLLLRTPRGWRVEDVDPDEGENLVAGLRAWIAEMERQQRGRR